VTIIDGGNVSGMTGKRRTDALCATLDMDLYRAEWHRHGHCG